MTDSTHLNCRERFLCACACKPVDRPPIWMMRQAGRSLPEYMKLKKGYKFTELVQNPELASEVTLQPIRRFGYDAAVVFSDILVIAEAMGQKYELMEQGGVKMDFELNSKADVDKLDPSRVLDHISYTPEAIKLTRKELGDERAIIGFAGSPWTLASFMVEGGSSRENLRSRAMLYNEPKLFYTLLEKITEATITYVKAQIEAGADVIQLFDSQGGTLAPNMFWKISGLWMQQIIDAIGGEVPVIVFARNVHHNWQEVVQTGANVLGIDWGIRLPDVCKAIPGDVAVQGNLDPALLIARPDAAAAETQRILEEMRGRNGFIFNLGHGVPPEADLDAIQAVAATVQNFK
ncbi:uroporphyrinogen decarboxylase [Pontiella sulfatireligans]|uniref:Uroporphyrinogen decarboxylase n=1 Tax=Pontiella sulfatireligans TaxID=2750658 RepID=A0A6C2UID3_9BACT|nr:uroporphyrinogen decarboxylase [Pontiella sulfatireligans]VGO19888.1 Uroporphyrinogen decarboxylase [Pontiella sulfatireligans]